MIPLPAGFAGSELFMWRLDREVYRPTWNSGEGARRSGGRWNSIGRRAVYCSVDPATAIVEVAVHTGFPHLDTVPHVLTAARILEPSRVFVVQHEDVPNPNWLRPGMPSAGQQSYGDSLLHDHPFVLIPSAVSTFSWNLIFNPETAEALYAMHQQDRFALDTRLHQPAR